MNLLERLLHIKLMVFDLDGVLTDGKVLLIGNGEWTRQMHIKDGYAIQHAIKSGFQIAVISGSHSDQVDMRLKKLGVTTFIQGANKKSTHLIQMLQQHGYSNENLLYMGDDIPDLDPFNIAGVKVCPADAAVELKTAADIITLKEGGNGCVREIIEKVMRIQDKWNEDNEISSI